MKYVAFEDQFIAKGFAHAGALASGQTGKLYLDGVKVKTKDAVIEVDDSYEFVTKELKDKEKSTVEDANADKVEKVKTKAEKDKDKVK